MTKNIFEKAKAQVDKIKEVCFLYHLSIWIKTEEIENKIKELANNYSKIYYRSTYVDHGTIFRELMYKSNNKKHLDEFISKIKEISSDITFDLSSLKIRVYETYE